MGKKLIKLLNMDEIMVKVVRKDSEFLKDMEVGDSKAIVLKDSTVVVMRKICDSSIRGFVEMDISVIPSVKLNAILVDEDEEDYEDDF